MQQLLLGSAVRFADLSLQPKSEIYIDGMEYGMQIKRNLPMSVSVGGRVQSILHLLLVLR